MPPWCHGRLDRPCIVGCEAIRIDLDARTFTIGYETFAERAAISIDGTDRRVFVGVIPVTVAGSDDPSLMRFLATARQSTGADLWSAVRNEAEAVRATLHDACGLGLVSIAGLIISAGRDDPDATAPPRKSR